MLSGIRKLLGKSETSQSAPPWLRDLGETSIFVISATVSEGIDASTMTQEQLLGEIRQALERDRENQQKGNGLFHYLANNQRRLPFFTSNDHATKFCGEYSKQFNRVFPFMVLQTQGTFLGKLLPSSFDVVVMNDKSDDERVLSDEDISFARRMWGNQTISPRPGGQPI
ncbi:MAG TPA: hypothetical protein VFE58_17545 [Tepidisphaeraceae bacterium]|jgi:hypothetical protein|nr:hypothetical protein [Tepidisphaeraceae bacterium]